jgi:hypothetical protein
LAIIEPVVVPVKLRTCPINPYTGTFQAVDETIKANKVGKVTFVMMVDWAGSDQEADMTKIFDQINKDKRFKDRIMTTNKLIHKEDKSAEDKYRSARLAALPAYLVGCVPVATGCGLVTKVGWGVFFDIGFDCVLPTIIAAYSEMSGVTELFDWIGENVLGPIGSLGKSIIGALTGIDIGSRPVTPTSSAAPTPTGALTLLSSSLGQEGEASCPAGTLMATAAAPPNTPNAAGQEVKKEEFGFLPGSNLTGTPEFKGLASMTTVASIIDFGLIRSAGMANMQFVTSTGQEISQQYAQTMIPDSLIQASGGEITQETRETLQKNIYDSYVKKFTEPGADGRRLLNTRVNGGQVQELTGRVVRETDTSTLTDSFLRLRNNVPNGAPEFGNLRAQVNAQWRNADFYRNQTQFFEDVKGGMGPVRNEFFSGNAAAVKNRMKDKVVNDIVDRLRAQNINPSANLRTELHNVIDPRIDALTPNVVDPGNPRRGIPARFSLEIEDAAVKNLSEVALKEDAVHRQVVNGISDAFVEKRVGQEFMERVGRNATTATNAQNLGGLRLKNVGRRLFSWQMAKNLGKGLLCGLLASAAGAFTWNNWWKIKAGTPTLGETVNLEVDQANNTVRKGDLVELEVETLASGSLNLKARRLVNPADIKPGSRWLEDCEGRSTKLGWDGKPPGST